MDKPKKTKRKNPTRRCRKQFKHKDITIINPSEDANRRNRPKFELEKLLEKTGQNLKGNFYFNTHCGLKCTR